MGPAKEMGAVHKVRFEFSRLDGIREAYASAFPEKEGSKDIDAALTDDALDALSALRNVIVHRGGKADKEYVARCSYLPNLPKAEERHIPLKIGRDRMVIVARSCVPMYRRLRYAVVTAAVVTPLLGLPGHGAERAGAQLAARSLEPTTHQPPAEPLPRFGARADRLELTRRVGRGGSCRSLRDFLGELSPSASDRPAGGRELSSLSSRVFSMANDSFGREASKQSACLWMAELRGDKHERTD
jgi:hypothetical protein